MTGSTTDPGRPPLAPALEGRPAPRRRLHVLVVVLGIALASLAVQVFRDPGSFQLVITILTESESAEGSFVNSRPKIIEQNGHKLLWGGPTDEMHFDVTDATLRFNRLHYGLGREAFPALIEPQFVAAEKVDWLSPEARVLSVHMGDQVKVYPVDLLTRHEVVNDTVDGRPIFAAYCILADLGAVYDRKLGDHTLTFGVTGYTYSETNIWSGLDAFVLWDRDTESLWWPPAGRAVAGPLNGQHLKLLETNLWKQTTWNVVRSAHPQARVLAPGQDFKRPATWPDLAVTPARSDAPVIGTEIAPRWGKNP